jgi:hypothetical protein
MRLYAPPARPGIGFVVTVDVSEQQACCCPVDDDAKVVIDSRRPKVRIARVVDAVHLQAGMLRVGLQVEGGKFCGLLVGRRKSRQRVGEGVGDKEIHGTIPSGGVT